MKNWFDDIKKYYLSGLWTTEMVQNAVLKGKITETQLHEIVKGSSEVIQE